MQTGRFGYASGDEAQSGDPKVEAVSCSFLRREGFEEDANRTMTGVRVATATVTLAPDTPLARTEWQLFAARYDDARRVTMRPDNSGLSAARADVHVTTLGTTLVSAHAAGRGELDALVWLAAQTGDWYGDDHRASAGSLEGGYQWTGAPARPWLRGGWLRAAGDRDASDRRHETFFQILPIVRWHALSATYCQMNLRDLFAELLAKPSERVNLRAGVHRLDLDRAADRWYSGSGAAQREGRLFGFSGRPSAARRASGRSSKWPSTWAAAAIDRRWLRRPHRRPGSGRSGLP